MKPHYQYRVEENDAEETIVHWGLWLLVPLAPAAIAVLAIGFAIGAVLSAALYSLSAALWCVSFGHIGHNPEQAAKKCADSLKDMIDSLRN